MRDSLNQRDAEVDEKQEERYEAGFHLADTFATPKPKVK